MKTQKLKSFFDFKAFMAFIAGAGAAAVFAFFIAFIAVHAAAVFIAFFIAFFAIGMVRTERESNSQNVWSCKPSLTQKECIVHPITTQSNLKTIQG